MSGHAGPAALGERPDHVFGDRAFLEEVLGVRDRLPRAPDRGGERGEDLLTVEQYLHFVAVDDGRPGVSLKGRVETGLAELDGRQSRDARVDLGAPGQQDTSEQGAQGDAEP